MKKLVGFWHILILPLVIVSCNPVLYQPNTPNIPTLTKERPSELKIWTGFRNIDVHYNRLDTSNRHFYQVSFSNSSIWQESGIDLSLSRIGFGYGWQKVRGQSVNMLSLYSGYSVFNEASFEIFSLYGPLLQRGPQNVILNGNQFHFSGTLAQRANRTDYDLTISSTLDLNYLPRFSQTLFDLDTLSGTMLTTQYDVRNALYAVLCLQLQLNYEKLVQLSVGTKIPLRHGGEFSGPAFMTTEYLYVRMGLWLKWGRHDHARL